MIINGKYFVPPPRKSMDVKELFLQMAREGAGRPVDKSGVPDGPWTPELLTDAIYEVQINRSGVELRTVQRWFQDNNQGISVDNIRWLARIFGCNEPEASSRWQKELSAAQSRLMAKRRASRSCDKTADLKSTIPSDNADFDAKAAVQNKSLSLRLAQGTEAIYGGGSSLNLPAFVFAGSVVLGFLAFILGVHSVTYSPVDGLNKQVGFFWAPNWTLLGMVLLPLYLYFVIDLLAFWKTEGRSKFMLKSIQADGIDGWDRKIQMFSYLYLIVLFISFFVVFLLQWSGVHLRTLMQGDVGNFVVDWSLIAVVRPEVISVPAAILITMFAFLYTASNTFLYLTGLIFIYSVAFDFFETNQTTQQKDADFKRNVRKVGQKIMCGAYRCTILGLLMIICMKAQTMYLLSAAETFVSWLVHDVLVVLGAHDVESHRLNYEAMAQFTTLLLLLLTVTLFVLCCFLVSRTLEMSTSPDAVDGLSEFQQDQGVNSQYTVPWWKMAAVVGILVTTYFLIGVIVGFSILLGVGLLLAIYSLYDPLFGQKGV